MQGKLELNPLNPALPSNSAQNPLCSPGYFWQIWSLSFSVWAYVFQIWSNKTGYKWLSILLQTMFFVFLSF